MKKAVAILLKCSDEYLLIKRNINLKAFPGYTALVGGKIDPVDYDERDLSSFTTTSEHLKCIKREIKEELGFELSYETLDKRLNFLEEIITPDYNPVRFHTFFYELELDQWPEIKPCSKEVDKVIIRSAKDHYQDWLDGNSLMVPPVRELIKSIVFNKDYTFSKSRGLIPHTEYIKDLIQLMPRSNTVPPATRTNTFIVDDLLIDFAPRDKDEYNNSISYIRNLNISRILITHHHFDHHKFTPQLAKDLSLDILISQDSYNRCLNKYGKNYFQEASIRIVTDGDTAGYWMDEKLLILSVPGHDEGHIAIMPENKKWCIVGDLFQGIGTVVVGGEEGDMTKYFASLKKIIKIDPKVVIPSHGIPLGSTSIIKKTLRHRELREDQIKDLLAKGKTTRDIYNIIYFDIPKALEKYAIANIESHINKIRYDLTR